MIINGTTVEVQAGHPTEKIFVVATTHKAFVNWCRGYSIDSNSPNVKYVRDPSDFRGVKDAWVKDLGTSFEKADQIYDIIWANELTTNFKMIP